MINYNLLIPVVQFKSVFIQNGGDFLCFLSFRVYFIDNISITSDITEITHKILNKCLNNSNRLSLQEHAKFLLTS